MTATIYETYNVTFEQVQACERLINESTRRSYYVVASSQNDGTEYTVYFDTTHKVLICTCAASQNGRSCWHKRAVQAHVAELKANRKALHEKEEAEAMREIDAENVRDALHIEQHERDAVALDGENAYNRKPFSFLR